MNNKPCVDLRGQIIWIYGTRCWELDSSATSFTDQYKQFATNLKWGMAGMKMKLQWIHKITGKMVIVLMASFYHLRFMCRCSFEYWYQSAYWWCTLLTLEAEPNGFLVTQRL